MRKGKRLLAVSLAMVMAVSSFAGNGYVAKAAGIDTDEVTALGKSKKAVTSVSITNVDDPVLVLKKKGTYKLKVKVTATGGASKKVTFKSSKPKIVSVSSKGKLKAKKNGTAKITVKSKFNKKKKAVLTVKVGTPVKKVELKESNIAIKVGETAILAATVSPKKPTRKILSYISSDEKIATVDKNGVVTAVAAGEAKITVKATDGSKKKAVATVTVTEAATTPGQPGGDTTTPGDTTTTPGDTTEKPGDTTTKPGDTTEDSGKEEPKYESPYTEKDCVWVDDFDKPGLNLNDWNIEGHEAGWVNSEWQEYIYEADGTVEETDDGKFFESDNIYVEDSKLVIKAIQKEEGKLESGNFTSGRINTRGIHNYKYGKFEARLKVPEGMGFLPAFWMMPTDENLYGQWPKCGEIDIMEIMGQEPDKLYGTIHYGEPHRESQGTKKIKGDDFSDDFHVFSCEWEPGKIKWIVDGVLYHEESDWYSAKSGQGTVSYPAPFDQPFYMILNLAVGGSWVGNPDDTTSFENAELVVDYVKVYQKDESEYDENVKKPEKDVVLRDPDENGNYVNNGDFTVAESLTDDKDWVFMTALGGEAEAVIANGAMNITTTKEGTVDYSVQLVQAGIPFEKGATYQVSFDAKASAARTMKVDVKAPDYGYASYMPSKTVELTTERKNYSYEFKMTGDSDANGRLEFNMGAAGSTADITISNVVIMKTKKANPDEKEEKTVLADGNHVYNGSFQEGEGRLGYWEITNNAEADISVTNLADGRRLKVTLPEGNDTSVVTLKQSDLALVTGMKYALSFDADTDNANTLTVKVGNTLLNESPELTASKKTYSYTFDTTKLEQLDNTDIVFELGGKGTIHLDNVILVEDSLIKNGSFNAGTTGYQVWVDTNNGAKAEAGVDSLTEGNDNAIVFTIEKTGKEEHYIQLKQENVRLEKGQWYKLKFDIKSSIDRAIQYSIQRNGNIHQNDWTPYVQDTESLTGGAPYQTIEKIFQMKSDSDPASVFNIAMGAVNKREINEMHTVTIDNISLEEVEAPEQEEIPVGKNLLEDDGNFANGQGAWEGGANDTGAADVSYDDGKATIHITNVGKEEWNVQLKHLGIPLEQGCDYTVSLKASSTQDRTIKVVLMDAATSEDGWYGGKDAISLTADLETYTFPVHMTKDTDDNAGIFISMGQIGDEELKEHTITLSDISIVKNSEGELEDPDTPDTPEENLLKNADFANNGEGWNLNGPDYSDAEATVKYENNEAIITIGNVGTENYHIQLTRDDVKLEQGKTYIISFMATSTETRYIEACVKTKGATGDNYYTGKEKLEKDTLTEVKFPVKVEEQTAEDNVGSFIISMGQIENEDTPISTITISDVSIVEQKDEEEQIEAKPMNVNLLLNPEFAESNKDPWWSNGVEKEDIQGNAITLTINGVGEAAYGVQFGQSNIQLEKGCTYQITFKVKSDVARDIICKMGGAADPWPTYGNQQTSLSGNSDFETVDFQFTMDSTDKAATFEIDLGKINNGDENLGEHKITISDLSLMKIVEAE